jgi:peptidyl-prolyl cis-trans isomerase A (cyclophilin A)
VAYFIGLATGEQAWLDMKTGTVRNDPFYEGLTFHRVVTNFMVQAGSPNGEGNDGPGYVFTDEYDNSLRFDGFGRLAMANSGQDSNGGQFFITTTNNTSWLNDRHTIFGRLTGGSNVVYSIGRVATDPLTDKPLASVVIQSVGIRRVGSAAKAFDIHKQGLPSVTSIPTRIRQTGSNSVALDFQGREYSLNRVLSTTNFHNWDQYAFMSQIRTPLTHTFDLTNEAPSLFFTVAQTLYPCVSLAPTNLNSRKLVLKITSPSGAGTVTVNFDAAGGGKASYSQGTSGKVLSYNWSLNVFDGGYLWPITFEYAFMRPLYLGIYFKDATSGNFRGVGYTAKGLEAIVGTFTLSAPQ